MNEIAVAVIKYHFDLGRYSAQGPIFIGVDGDDLSREMQSQLADFHLKVRPASEHTPGVPARTTPLFNILECKQVSEFEKEVFAEDWFDPFFSIRYRFFLKWRDGQWIVADAVEEHY